ncbi:toxic anion resistance protein [Scatolibacter rhodanostii]|uniref:toxic anion resistance protein n=1 Tax=Scatolibacter rhodanostii TaxID=2014781 RepID=UPI000C06F681|nr:toxic anion resistance protein [Scatolibacter rhodanostii]
MEQNEKITLSLESDMHTPSLTLDANEEMTFKPEEVQEAKPKAEILNEGSLSPEERKIVEEFAEKIDVTDSTVIMQYGSGAQKKIAAFSDVALNKVSTKDLGEIGEDLTTLVTELKGFDAEEEEKGLFGFFKNSGKKIKAIKVKYDKAQVNVDKVAKTLEGHQIQLLKDIVMLDKLYDQNLSYQKELTMYIIAGKKKLNLERETTLVALRDKAQKSALPEDAQTANDFMQQCDAFEKKLHDLELTRMVSIQMSPQIRLVQNNNKIMSEKIQSTILNTIPLWKSQMVLSLGLAHSEQAVQAQRQVSDMTNQLLKKNADRLKISTIETAKESERGIVDLETLKHTNESLLQTLDEVMRIQDEGRTKRREAEGEIARLETELKQKLLDMR